MKENYEIQKELRLFEEAGEWWRKYTTATSFEPSLNGAITTFYDKWGAVIAKRNSFGESWCVYYDEKDYLDSIKNAPEPKLKGEMK